MLRRTITTAVLLGATATADAGLISFTGMGGVVDASSETRTVTVDESDLAGLIDTVLDANLMIDYAKCGRRADALGCFGGSGSTFNSEIVFELSHAGVLVSIVEEGTFSGQARNADVVQLFDDQALHAAGGAVLSSGSFRPVGRLSDFAGQSALGAWSFRFEDTVGQDPLSVQSWRLDLTLADAEPAAVPEPSSLALLGLGLAGFGAAARHRRR